MWCFLGQCYEYIPFLLKVECLIIDPNENLPDPWWLLQWISSCLYSGHSYFRDFLLGYFYHWTFISSFLQGCWIGAYQILWGVLLCIFNQTLSSWDYLSLVIEEFANGTMPGTDLIFYFLFYFIFCFLELYLQHMKVPRLGAKLELQLLTYAYATATARSWSKPHLQPT